MIRDKFRYNKIKKMINNNICKSKKVKKMLQRKIKSYQRYYKVLKNI